MISNLCVYKISFQNTYQTISNLDLEKIAELDIESSFDYKIDDFFYFFIITPKTEMKKYLKILDKNMINYTFENLSDLILKNEYDFTYIEDYLDDENEIIYEIFTEDLNKWIYSNLDIDIILDIISLKGMESLRNIDKKFLRDNYENN